MKRLMNILVLSCQKASFLIEKGHASPLSFMERLQLNMHLKICDKCAAYKQQSRIIESLLQKQAYDFTEFKLADSSKARMEKIVRDQMDKN
ncbi:hypothetical protein BH09BAC5_BH09BAC5_03140 [soil metagenome]